MAELREKHFGRVYSGILSEIERDGGLAFVVIDPPNQSPETAGKTAKLAEEAKIDAIAVGGSVGAQGSLLDGTISRIKENCSLPVILFPGNIATLSSKADAIYFMSMLNSLEPYYISGAQTAASLPVKKSGIEVIPTSYIIVEPGRAAGWVGRAKLIPREHSYLAAITALAGQYMGSHVAILESGGGAPKPVPLDMIKQTSSLIDIPLVIAGGVKNKAHAHSVIKAGADIIHVGTAIEHSSSDLSEAGKKLAGFSRAVKKAGKEKK